MLTYEDCLGLCELSAEEVLAIAEHEHVPEIVAIEMAEYIINQPDGIPRIKKIILDDLKRAQRHGNKQHEETLRQVLKHFIVTHPEFSPARKAS